MLYPGHPDDVSSMPAEVGVIAQGAKLPVDRRPSSPAPPVYQEEFESFFNCEGAGPASVKLCSSALLFLHSASEQQSSGCIQACKDNCLSKKYLSLQPCFGNETCALSRHADLVGRLPSPFDLDSMSTASLMCLQLNFKFTSRPISSPWSHSSGCHIGRMVGWKKFKERVFSSGIEAGLRQTAWKFLLGFYLYDSTLAERKALLTAKRAEYARMKSQWRTLNDEQASRLALQPCCPQTSHLSHPTHARKCSCCNSSCLLLLLH